MRRAYRDMIAATVIVNLKSGRAFRGVLWDDHRELLVLRNATLLEDGQTAAVDGEVVIERTHIDFMQVVTA